MQRKAISINIEANTANTLEAIMGIDNKLKLLQSTQERLKKQTKSLVEGNAALNKLSTAQKKKELSVETQALIKYGDSLEKIDKSQKRLTMLSEKRDNQNQLRKKIASERAEIKRKLEHGEATEKLRTRFQRLNKEYERVSTGLSKTLKDIKDEKNSIDDLNKSLEKNEQIYKRVGHNQERLQKRLEASVRLERIRQGVADREEQVVFKKAERRIEAAKRLERIHQGIIDRKLAAQKMVMNSFQNLPLIAGLQGGTTASIGALAGQLAFRSPLGGIVGGLAGGVLAGGAAYALNATLNSYAPLEATLNKIKAIAPDVAQSLAKIEQSSFELGSKTSFNAGEVAIGYKELAKMGYKAQEMLAAMPGLLNAAMVSEMDLATTTEIVAGTLNGFHLAAKESMRVADVLAKAAAVSAADIPDLGEGLKQIAPVAYDSKQGLEEMAASLSILADNMVKGSDAGTDMKAIMLNLFSIEGQGTKKNAGIHAQLDKLGVKITDAKGKMRPFLDIMQDLGKATQGLSDTQRMTLFENIAGKENIKTLSILTAASTGKVNELRNAFDKAGGSSDKAAKLMRDGVGAAADEVAGSFETMSAKLGKLFAPATISGLNLLKTTLDGISFGIQVLTLPSKPEEKKRFDLTSWRTASVGQSSATFDGRPSRPVNGVNFLPKALGGNTTTVINMGKVTIQAQNPKDFVKQTQAHAKQAQRLKKS